MSDTQMFGGSGFLIQLVEYFMGGRWWTHLTVTIEYITIAINRNAIDFGDKTYGARAIRIMSSPTRGIIAGGYGISYPQYDNN